MQKRTLNIVYFLFITTQLWSINFKHLSLDQSLSLAKSENKLILVAYTAPWCYPCEIMKNGAYVDIQVNEVISQKMIAIKVQYDLPHDESWLQNYPISILPTHLILDSEGNIMARAEGGMSIEKFKYFIQNLNSQQSPYVEYVHEENKIISTTEPITISNSRKVYLDGVLVDESALQNVQNNISKIDQNIPQANNILQQNQIEVTPNYSSDTPTQVDTTSSGKSNSSTSNVVNNSIPEVWVYYVQLGAFPSANKAHGHIKNIQTRIKRPLTVITDSSKSYLPYKVVIEDQFNFTEADNLVSILKNKGWDCFVKAVKVNQ